MDFCHLTIWQQETLLYDMFRSFGFDRDQMISNLQRMFPAWIMTFSIWLISSGGQSTTK